MSASRPEDIDDLLQDLEQEYGEDRALSPDVEKLLRDLGRTNLLAVRRRAAQELGRLESSDPRVVRDLLAAKESDVSPWIRELATEALQAPAHREILRQHPELEERAAEAVPAPMDRETRQRLSERSDAAERLPRARREPAPAKPVRPPYHIRVGTEGDALRMSWQPDMSQRLSSARVPLVLLLLFVLLLFVLLLPARIYEEFPVVLTVGCVLATASAYWIAAIFTSETRVAADADRWTFRRGRLPLPDGRFYLPARRLDRPPAGACGPLQ